MVKIPKNTPLGCSSLSCYWSLLLVSCWEFSQENDLQTHISSIKSAPVNILKLHTVYFTLCCIKLLILEWRSLTAAQLTGSIWRRFHILQCSDSHLIHKKTAMNIRSKTTATPEAAYAEVLLSVSVQRCRRGKREIILKYRYVEIMVEVRSQKYTWKYRCKFTIYYSERKEMDGFFYPLL